MNGPDDDFDPTDPVVLAQLTGATYDVDGGQQLVQGA